MERFQDLHYSGKKVLVVDFSACAREEYLDLQRQLLALLESRRDHSVRLVLNLQGLDPEPAFGLAWKTSLAMLRGKVLCSALCGLSPFAEIQLQGIARSARFQGLGWNDDCARSFRSRGEALEWATRAGKSRSGPDFPEGPSGG